MDTAAKTAELEEMRQAVEDEIFQIEAFNRQLGKEIGNIKADIVRIHKIIARRRGQTGV